MATNGVNGANGAPHLPALAHNAGDFLQHKYDYVIVGGGTFSAMQSRSHTAC